MRSVFATACGNSANDLRHLCGRLEVVLGVLAPQLMAGVQRRPVLDRHQHVLEPVPLACVIVDVPRRDDAELQVLRQLSQRPVPADIAVNEVALKLDEEILGAKPFCISPRHRFRLSMLPCGDQRRNLASAAARERDQPLGVTCEHLEFDARLAALVVEVSVREQTAEVGVPVLRLAEERQVMAVCKRDLGAGNRPQPPGARALRELHRAVQAIVVRERQRLVSQLERTQDELLDMRSAFEKGEVGVGVEFGVGRHRLVSW